MAKSTRAPWKRSNPRKRAGKASKHLSPAQKSAAKARARRAGRRYPNLVDNMRMAKKKKSSKKKSSKKTSKSKASKAKSTTSAKKTRKRNAKKAKSRKRRASAREKDPRGGLTAAGRKAFARKQGAHLRPGVTKPESEMTPQEMRRKGSWAVRFYGRAKLPPLVDGKGQPTRHALSAHAWGEPVPKTVAAARRIAAKGERLLARYRRAKARA
ncbi:DUF6321 domain-containing protein [Bradyrhizobium centrosematis]|uniref:DUF6321 domain-containing protein n=1 Tax=Bradyrhizobium centrosematis TaxID=1300039 RepID=UPI00216A1B8B|nr:DUF6321 domain-containing protein [Bradyrhizobium centrosematis]MCS3758343.1 hypothetical protein [Bradyrhizobium centrosematis]MCS3773768.1 hypothetical protein [Bradyrhizobium centrosematis]